MSWAPQEDVLKYHRMLTEREALIRQLMLSCQVGLGLTVFVFIYVPLSRVLTVAVLAYLIYDSLSLRWPNSQYYLLSSLTEVLNIISAPKRKQPAEPATSPEDNPSPAKKDVPLSQKSYVRVKNPLVERILLSRQAVAAYKIVIGLAAGTLLSGIIYAVEQLYLALLLLVLYWGSAFLMVTSFLYYIESLELDEFPTATRDKLMLSFFKKYSFSRGFYFIGEVNGKKVGLPRMLRFMHSLIAAPTGEGKSTRLIIPPLLFDADAVGSAVVPDAKSPELFNWVAGRWYSKGKKVFLFDPWNPECIGINLLTGADDKDLLTIVEVMMREREEAIGKEDPFFKSRTRYLLYAILKLVQSFEDKFRNLTSVYYLVQRIEVLTSAIDTSQDAIKALFADFHKLGHETKVNALTSLREKLDIFMDENVRKAFSRSEFTLSMLFKEKEPCLLVLGAPIDNKEAGTKIASLIVNLIINMAFKERRLYKQATQRGEKGFQPNDLYLYLDELRSLKITALADLISIARETRTHVIGSTTDIFFFKYYKEDFSSIMGNFRTRMCMRGLDYESSKYISDSLGKENVVTYKYMRGVMASQEQRNRLDPDQVMNLPDEKMIVFSPKTAAFIADTVSIHNTRWLQKMQVPAPQNMREIYKGWNIVKDPLEDPILPMKNGFMDFEQIRGTKEVLVNPSITPKSFETKDIFEERGGGRWTKYEGMVPEVIQGETIQVRTDEDDVVVGADM